MISDAIGNFLTVIRNALKVSHRDLSVPHSKVKEAIASILKNEGFIRDFRVIDQENNKKSLHITLKYVQGESVIHEIKRISTPGRRIYQHVDDIKHVAGKFGISVVSTNRGMITNKEAKTLRVGGEILCSVW